MDYNEIGKGMVNRHPWELSRTEMIIGEWKRYIDKLRSEGKSSYDYVNIGAGDMYFDDALMKSQKGTSVYAVDLGYDTKGEKVLNEGGKHLTNDIDSIDDGIRFDFSIMMDSLEYMPDDREYITKLAKRVKSGGYMFFTLPAYKKLFSDHDIHVGNLRRYDRKEIEKLIRGMDGIEIVYSRHFYFSLYLVRLFQVITKAPIDPEQKVTTGWNYKETSIMTMLVKGILNLDYRLGRFLPGLSLMIVCRKK